MACVHGAGEPGPGPTEGCLREVAVSFVRAGSPRLSREQGTELELKGNQAVWCRGCRGDLQPTLCPSDRDPL